MTDHEDLEERRRRAEEKERRFVEHYGISRERFMEEVLKQEVNHPDDPIPISRDPIAWLALALCLAMLVVFIIALARGWNG